jgi:gluconolactonase
MAALVLISMLALAAQTQEDFLELRIERMSSGYRFADGPVWTPDRKLIFAEVPSNTIYHWMPGHKVEPMRSESNGAQGLAYDAQERLYICESKTRRVVRYDKRGKVEVLAEKWEGKRLNSPNDIAIRKDGHAYFTDAFFGSGAKPELDFNGVFHITPKGELNLVAKWKGTRPNGIAVSPNGKSLYVSSADDRKIVVFDLDRNGAATNERPWASNVNGPPAGIRCDEKGHVYVANKGISIFTPEGKLIREVELADSPSNLAFGEGDLQTLFVTTRRSLYRIRVPYRGSLTYINLAPQQPGSDH